MGGNEMSKTGKINDFQKTRCESHEKRNAEYLINQYSNYLDRFKNRDSVNNHHPRWWLNGGP
jgi:hypothetical protein